MARRHSRRGCHCTTCTNERIYDRSPDELARRAAWWAGLDEISYAHHASMKREAKRRRAEERDNSRLEELRRRAAT